jgi:hypothetical protein
MKFGAWAFAAGAALAIAAAAYAADNTAGTSRVPQPNVMNPAGMGAVPPSTYAPAYKSTRGDIYAGGGAGNLIVTGDVAGGRQFRGVVPYSSVNAIGAPTGTASVDNFVKRSESAGYDAAPGTVRPYYVPMQTVSKLPAPGTSSTAPATQPGGTLLKPAEVRPEELGLQGIAEQYRPLSRTPEETAGLMLKQYPASQAETSLLRAINDVRQKELAEQIEKIKQQASELAESVQKPGIEPEKGAEPEKTLSTKPYEPLTGVPEPVTTAQRPVDIYDKMLQQLDKDYDEYMKGREEAAAAAKTEAGTEQPEKGPLAESKERLAEALKSSTTGERIDPKELNAKGYKLYMDLAAEYMKQKKFYKAAETYGLARSYQEKPESFAGQGWALLGTGEYMSSAYYLGRAIGLDPNIATAKVDLAGLLGADLLAQRLADLEQWQQKTYSPEMQFLLAFAYYETGKTRDAEDAIRAAAIKMEAYRPATILKDVIVGK